MTTFIFGLGFSSLEFVRLHGHEFGPVSGTVRSREKAERLSPDGVVSPMLFASELHDDRIEPALFAARFLLVSVPPGEDGDPVLDRFAQTILGMKRLERIVYLSTVGVYGDHGGEWVDEATPPRPVARRSQLRLAAESSWTKVASERGCALDIFRLSGIYGPGRNALASLASGTTKRIVKPGQVFNRIHVTDIAHAVRAALSSARPGAIYNVTDDEPAPPQDVVAFAADLLGMPPPPETAFDEAAMSLMARSFYGENKRVSNARIKRDLNVRFAFPTYREGLRALLDAGEGARSGR